MKKFLVTLLVLAVAGGVFAQEGEWSVSGKATIGAFIDFDGNDGTEDAAMSIGSSFNIPYDWWDGITGALTINYNKGGLGAFIGFSQRYDQFKGGFTYNGEKYKFNVETNLAYLLNSWDRWDYIQVTDPDTGEVTLEKINGWNGTWRSVDRLWGSYSMVNDIVNLEIAFKSRDTDFWNSDLTAAFYYDDWQSFTKVDGANYFLTDIRLSGLSFGLMMKNIFNTGEVGYTRNPSYPGVNAHGYPGGLSDSLGWVNTGYKLIDDILKKMIFGVKFEMHPIEVAAQFLMEDYGVYLGAKWFVADPVTVGLSFMGIFPDAPGVQTVKAGANVAYNAESFGASLGGYYFVAGSPGITSTIGLEPSFWYNVLPTHLQFKTNLGFYFVSDLVADSMEIFWKIEPMIFWNFLGTGAGGWDTGMAFRYRLEKDTFNEFDVTFKFSF